MNKKNCQKCIHFAGRLVTASGKLEWGSFCTYRAYAADLPPEPLQGQQCPMDRERDHDE